MVGETIEASPIGKMQVANGRGFRRALGWLSATVCLALCAPTIVAIGAPWSWQCELFTHFRVYYVIVLLFGLCLTVCRRYVGLGLLTVSCLAANLLAIAPCFVPTSRPQPPSSTNVRALVANLFYLNPRRSALIEYVRRESPDMLVLFEVNPAWQRTLAELEEAYPYQLANYRTLGDGIALFSRRDRSARSCFSWDQATG